METVPALRGAGIDGCSTSNKVFHGKKPTIWGDTRPSHNKPWHGGVCARCPAPRDSKASYCLPCRRMYKRLWLVAQKAKNT